MAKSSLDVDEEDDYIRQAVTVARSALDICEVPVGCALPTPQGSVLFSPGTSQVIATGDQMPQEEEQQLQQPLPWRFQVSGKKIVVSVLLIFIAMIIWDAMFTAPEDRLLKPDFVDTFLLWVQANPNKGALGLVVVIAFALVFMLPLGTPLALGCGYIYKSAYGWKWGLTIATSVSMVGSAVGAAICFLLGRYLMRDQVRTWIRNYPLFVAIDIAAAEQGFRIMTMLYLTPIMPLGPISYMCGTTSMALWSFLTAKIASLPLKLLYAVIGGSAVGSAQALAGKSSEDGSAGDGLKDIQENRSLIVSGILFSFVMIAWITHYTKKELNKILDRQKNHKPSDTVQFDDDVELTSLVETNEEAAMEIGSPLSAPRQRLNSQGYKAGFDTLAYPSMNEEAAIEIGSPHSAPRQRLNSSGYKGFETVPYPSTNLSLYRGT